ncbi:MAG: hypothetical protein QG671_2093 [Actinomycetota bacterium]|nr:hypothetical protein [Actinomycetota bacterium]
MLGTDLPAPPCESCHTIQVMRVSKSCVRATWYPGVAESKAPPGRREPKPPLAASLSARHIVPGQSASAFSCPEDGLPFIGASGLRALAPKPATGGMSPCRLSTWSTMRVVRPGHGGLGSLGFPRGPGGVTGG